MKKFLAVAMLLFGLTVMYGRSLPAYADDAPPPPKADAAKPEAPKEGGGEEGGSKKKGSGDVSGGRFAGDPVYVRLLPITLPIISENGIEQLVTIQITVEVKDFDVGDDMHSNLPRVMDALNRALYGGLGDGSVRDGKLVDVNKVKARATAALQSVEGVDNIKDVLIVNISQRLL